MNRLPGLAFGCDKYNEMPYFKTVDTIYKMKP